MTHFDFDLAILGSGFGGSLAAMVARRLGLSVLLIERGTHPRFAVGESSSPLANLLLEELAREYDLPRLLPLTAYGSWKRTFPDMAVGLKRGFTFYRHRAGQPLTPEEEARPYLVAASPNDEVSDTHWYRADFDHFLVQEAQSLGVEYVDQTRIDRYERTGGWTTLCGTRAGQPVAYRTRFVLDAGGPRGGLARLLGLSERTFPDMPPTEALFSHFADVRRLADGLPGTPFPPDDAALHHLLEGGWFWVLRFENGITSVGAAVEQPLARELRLEEGAPGWERLLDRFPSVRAHLEGSEAVLPFMHMPRLSYRCDVAAGDGWAMLPSAAAFVDPLFSTGFPLTLLGIHRLGTLLRHPETLAERLPEYAAATFLEAQAAATLVGGCYATFGNLGHFEALSQFYFAAASFSEMARRLGRPHLAARFLLQNQPAFRRAFQEHCGRARRDGRVDQGAIARDLEPFNIAGLCDPGKRGWYGVDLEDVVRGASKLGCTPVEVQEFFRRNGW